MTLANLYLDLGFCETYPSTLLHCAINFPLSTDIAMISQQIIACPIGKRVVVLAGRITSNEECHILICDDDFPIDHHAPEPFLFERADLPAENYLLPPTSICQPHMKTRMNKGLWFWGQTLSASSEERLVFGYLKYLLLEALPLGEPLWGVMEDCLTSPIEITWPPVTGAESYTLQRLDFVGDNDVLQWVTIYEGEDASFSVAAEGGIKSYRFKAENGDESTGWSEIRRIKVKPTFELTIALDESETICSVYWGAVAGVKYFEVYRDDVLIKTTNYLGIADPLVAGQTYNYRVRAYVVGLSNDCYSEATGSLEVVETCLQPVITDFHIGDFFGGGTGGMAYWTTENATSHEFYINNVASDIYYGTSTEWYGGEKGTTAIFKLIAKCGNLQAESSISHYFEPCPGSDRPIISVFNVTQAYDTGAVTFLWEATEIGRADIYNNDILVATSTDMIFIELTANGTLRGGSVTIPQPANLGQQTFILKAINYDAPSCIGEATQNFFVDQGDPCIGSGAPVINSFEISRSINLIVFSWTTSNATTAKLYENDILIFTDNNPDNTGYSVIRPTGYYEYRLDCLNAANCLTSTLQEMSVPDLTFKPIDESAFNYGFNSTGGNPICYFPTSGNDWNKCKGIVAQWPSNMGFPTPLSYEWILRDIYADYIDITIVQPYIHILKPLYSSQPSSHDLEKVARGKIAEAFALDYRPSQQPGYWWQRTFVSCSGVLGLQSADATKGDMWCKLQRGKGIDFAVVTPTVTYSDSMGIYKNPAYPRPYGNATGVLGSLAIETELLWVSFQVRNPVKSGGGYLRPVSAQVTAISQNDAIKQTATLTGCKYHTMSRGEISVIGGYITNSFYQANFFTSGTGNNSYLVLSQVSFGV